MLLPIILTLAGSANSSFAKLPHLKHSIAIIGHRGGRALAPENTLAAFKNAIRLGADYVEIDVRATKDGQLVIMHDSTVDRTTNGKGAVKDLNFAEIRSLDAGSKFSAEYASEKVPTFEEVLQLCKGKINIYLDHKEAPTEQCLELVKKHHMEKNVLVYNGIEGLLEWKKIAPHIPVMPSLPNQYRKAGGIAEIEKILPAEVLDGNLLEWTKELIDQAHANGVKVYVDNLGPYDNPPGFRKAIEMGVDGIQTDHLDQLIDVVKQIKKGDKHTGDYRGKAFVEVPGFREKHVTVTGEIELTSLRIFSAIPTNELIVSWNADTPAGTGLKIEASATCEGRETQFYTMGMWSNDGEAYPRSSVVGQKDIDGEVQTDTLLLYKPASYFQIKITLHPTTTGIFPELKYVGISMTDTSIQPETLQPNRAAWGKEIAVPSRTQLGYPNASGWCSPTSTAMTLAFWADRLHRPELNIPVPEVAQAIYDKVYDGTGNWPFNTAFAGSKPGMVAYVTRFSDIRELEDWIAAGIPVVVSCSYDLLLGSKRDADPGHLLVCDGFTKDGDVVLNDPAHHPERGETARRIFPRANFLKGWERSKKLVYLIYPENTVIPANIYGHWDAG